MPLTSEAASRPRANSSAAMAAVAVEYEAEEDAGPAPMGNAFNGGDPWQPRSDQVEDASAAPDSSLLAEAAAAPLAPLAPQTKEKAKSMLNLQFSLGPGNFQFCYEMRQSVGRRASKDTG